MSAAALTSAAPVSCREFADGLVTEHMEDALDVHGRQRVHEHLAGCPDCRRLLDEMTAVVRLLGTLRAA